ncbi:MAG: PP2C family serine/threonine-protein phosphatase [Chloroflexota bacterium]
MDDVRAGRADDFVSDLFDDFADASRDIANFFQSIGDTLMGTGKRKAQPARPESVRNDRPQTRQPRPAPATQPAAATQLLSTSLLPKTPGEAIGGYVILNVRSMQRSNYYKVRWDRCPQGHDNPGTPGMQAARAGNAPQLCRVCQAELKTFLVRETEMPAPVGDEKKRRTLIQLSQSGAASFLRHIAIFDQMGRRYAVCEYPGDGWQSLSQLDLPVTDNNRVVSWCWNLGSVLAILGEQGFAPSYSSIAECLEPIVLAEYHPIVFADLTIFNLTDLTPQAIQQRMVSYLAQLLYTLTSGKLQNLHRAPPDFSDVPAPFRGLLSRAAHEGSYQLKGFLEVLRTVLQVPESVRSLRQIAGYRSDPGRRREHNEDFVGKYSLGMQQSPDAAEIGLYLVADGMGGHQGGEVASREVVRVILEEIQEKIQDLQAAPKIKRSTILLDRTISPGSVLKSAILRANEVLYNARQQRGSDRGTTITAALVVGGECAIANVGDSRTYLWRDRQLSQITQDHSLVASLVAAKVIRPDEVRVHPQRNQIYRNLGDRATVEVDIFECALQAGDRLLLCSDGLWEMVLDAEMAKLLLQSANPQEACDRLVEAANLAGGEDNISVISVWMT